MLFSSNAILEDEADDAQEEEAAEEEDEEEEAPQPPSMPPGKGALKGKGKGGKGGSLVGPNNFVVAPRLSTFREIVQKRLEWDAMMAGK